MGKGKAIFTIFLWVSWISYSWTYPTSDDGDDAIFLQDDLEAHLRDIQDDLNAAAQEYRKEFDRSNEDEVVYAQKVTPIQVESMVHDDDGDSFNHQKILQHRFNLEDKEALLQHLHLIHQAGEKSVSSDEYSENGNEATIEDEVEPEDDPELDENSMDDIALKIQDLMERGNVKDNFNTAHSEIIKKPAGKNSKKISKETNKILNELKPDELKNQVWHSSHITGEVMMKTTDESSNKISEETNKILDELNPELKDQAWETDEDMEIDEAAEEIIHDLEAEDNKRRKSSKDTSV